MIWLNLDTAAHPIQNLLNAGKYSQGWQGSSDSQFSCEFDLTNEIHIIPVAFFDL